MGRDRQAELDNLFANQTYDDYPTDQGEQPKVDKRGFLKGVVGVAGAAVIVGGGVLAKNKLGKSGLLRGVFDEDDETVKPGATVQTPTKEPEQTKTPPTPKALPTQEKIPTATPEIAPTITPISKETKEAGLEMLRVETEEKFGRFMTEEAEPMFGKRIENRALNTTAGADYLGGIYKRLGEKTGSDTGVYEEMTMVDEGEVMYLVSKASMLMTVNFRCENDIF
jgi:hypothetical protein